MAHIVGTNGNDSLVGTNGQDTLEGLGGNDTLIGNDASDVLIGGAGADSMNGGLGGDLYVVGTGDVLSDPGGHDLVETSISWTLAAGFEDMRITGTAVTSNSGNDLANNITGSDGNNWLRGLQGDDTISGGGGNDTINMSSGSGASYGNDFIDGGDGTDTLDFGTAARTAVFVDLAAGTASGGGTAGAGTATLMNVENVNGSGFDDVLRGDLAANFLYGFNGNDTLDGGHGNDRLEGAAGNDRYTFTASPGATNADTIVGFASGADKVVLDATAHANLGAAGNFAAGDARFTSGAGRNTAQDSSDRVIYNTTTGQLWYDSDGTGAAPAQLVATLQGAPSLVATDLVGQGSGGGGGTFNGTAGNDTLIGGPGNDTLNGFGGHDYLEGREGADSMVGGDGNDTLEGGTGADVGLAEETTLADTLDGGLGDDHFYIRENDIIVDSGGVDTVHTDTWVYTLGSGFENLTYTTFQFSDGEGNVINYTGNELDNEISVPGLWISSFVTITGGAGDDTMSGSGNMTYVFARGYGNDHVIGGNESDTVDFSALTTSPVFIDLQFGTATSSGLDGGSVTMEDVGNAIGGALGDRIIGSSTGRAHFDFPQLSGGGGNDTLEGASSGTSYHLNGDDGNDRLVSHRGGDMMNGGAGADQFVLAFTPPASEGFIGDFLSGTDTIVLDATFMPALGPTGDFTAGDARFYAAAGATGGHDADDRVIFNTSSGELFYDADGNGSGAAQFLTQVAPGPTVVASDIAVENGTSEGQLINGTSGDDSINGGPGDDTINGLGGNDTLIGHNGADQLNGGDGNDLLDATIGGQNSGDFFADTLSGGLGDDVYRVHDEDTITADPGGIDTVFAKNSDWTLGAGLENLHSIDTVGSGFVLTGNELDNLISNAGSEGGVIFGMGGDDTLALGNAFNGSFASGGDGNDTVSAARDSELHGDAGNDVLISSLNGGTATTMTGGSGADTFLIHVPDAHQVTDFDRSDFDHIQLDATNMPALGSSGNFGIGDARFHAAAGATAGHDADDRVVYYSNTGDLYYDADGSGSGAAQVIAHLQSAPTLFAQHIEVINGTAGGGILVNGTAGDDSLTGTSGDDTINGLAGNDGLNGAGGSDTLDGGAGNDVLFGGDEPFDPNQGPDLLIGGDGDDRLVGAERFAMWPGTDDTLMGGLGNDVFHVDSGDAISDTGGVDLVIAENGSWTLAAGFENLEIITDLPEWGSGFGNELDNDMSISYRGDLHGGAGNDTLHGGNSRSELYGDDGNDLLIDGNADFSTLDGGVGNDTLLGAFSFMTGGAGADVFGSEEGSTINDFASGTDTIRVDGEIFADAGPSGRFAAGDARFHTGAAAHDADDRVIYNSATRELLYDADGNGGGAAITIATLQAGATVVATDIEVVNGTAPVGGQTINGTANNDTLVGGAGNDTINGNAGADLIQGMGGNDSLVGSTGWDTIQGGDGNDWMHGGGWSDTMSGGAGSDSFVWNDAGTGTRDTVTDFASGTDELLFDNAFFAALGANSAWAAGDGRFWAAAGATAGHDADDRLVYNTSNGNLYYDADGSGAGAAQVVATFQGGVSISAADITVI